MKALEIANFFDLHNFAHKALFDRVRYPWELLPLIEDYLAEQALGKIEVTIPPGVTLEHPETISIGEGTVVEAGAYIRGPCLIGKNCQIRQGAYIRGSFIAGDGCVVGHATEVKNSLFLNGAQAAHFAYLGDCILGNRVNLGAGTKCANLKLDHKEIEILFEGKKIKTGLRKLGAIIGDECQIGCNAVTNPGTLIFPLALWYPCVNHGGVVPRRALVRSGERSQVVDRQ